MTEESAALATALAYHRAWTGGDFERAMTYIADNIICLTPAGRLDGAQAFRGFMGPFASTLTRSELLAAFGNETSALLMYDTDTVHVHGAPAAEHLEVADGRVVRLRIIFDQTPFDAARRASAEG